MKNMCRNRNAGVYAKKCLEKKGCDTCDQVPCGKCQEGCSKSVCIVNGVTLSKNGCANGNMGKFPVRSTCLSGEITEATYATVAAPPVITSSVLDSAYEATMYTKECVTWVKDSKGEVANCVGLMKPKVVKDLLSCKKKFNPKKLASMLSDIKRNLKLAKMIKSFRWNIIKCIAKEYGMKIIEKALAYCKAVLDNSAGGCPKTGVFAK